MKTSSEILNNLFGANENPKADIPTVVYEDNKKFIVRLDSFKQFNQIIKTHGIIADWCHMKKECFWNDFSKNSDYVFQPTHYLVVSKKFDADHVKSIREKWRQAASDCRYKEQKKYRKLIEFQLIAFSTAFRPSNHEEIFVPWCHNLVNFGMNFDGVSKEYQEKYNEIVEIVMNFKNNL